MATGSVDLGSNTSSGGGGGGSVNDVTASPPLFSTGGTNPNISFIPQSSNTVAGFDNAGDLQSIPGWNIDTNWGGINQALTAQPDNATNYTSVNNYSFAIDPLSNANDAGFAMFNNYINVDPNSTGFNIGTDGEAFTMANNSFTHDGTSDLGQVNMMKNSFSLGTGSTTLSVNSIAYALGFGTIRNGVTVTNNVQGYGFQPTFEAGSSLTGYVQAFYDTAQIQDVSFYTSFTSSPTIAQVSNNSAFTGCSINPTITLMQGNAGFTGFSVDGNIGTLGTNGFQAIRINPTIGDASAPGSVSLLSISASNISNAQTIYSIQTSGGRIDTVGQAFSTYNTLDTGVDAIPAPPQPYGVNYLGGYFKVSAGDPITGNFGIGNNLGILTDIQDDVDPDFLNLGWVMNGFLTQVAVADTKTLDSITFMGAGAGLATVTTGGGTINKASMFRAIGLLPQGGTPTINELVGFRVDSLLSSASPVVAYGIKVEDPTAYNYFAGSVIVGGLTALPSNADVAIDVQDTKAVRFANMTTVQKNGLTPLAGMMVFDTTVNKLSYYDGSAWINI